MTFKSTSLLSLLLICVFRSAINAEEPLHQTPQTERQPRELPQKCRISNVHLITHKFAVDYCEEDSATQSLLPDLFEIERRREQDDEKVSIGGKLELDEQSPEIKITGGSLVIDIKTE